MSTANDELKYTVISKLRETLGSTKETEVVNAGPIGGSSTMGTSRKQNEDRYEFKMDPSGEKTGKPYAYIGVYDGHGGFATADWCKEKLFDYVVENWTQEPPDRSTRLGFINADRELLDKRGFLGLGERGVGGSKCGSTAAVALVYKAKGVATLLAAGAGDARVLVCENGKEPVQLTIDHVPDTESERLRIEAANPNLNMPIVQYVGGTWRVGGLLALSRSLGDAYMKESLVYEGISDKGNNYGSGFGVIADPDVEIVDISGKKTLPVTKGEETVGDGYSAVQCGEEVLVKERRWSPVVWCTVKAIGS
eukprot:gene9610-11384_t